MWNGTKKLAEKISEGIGLADSNVMVKLYNIAKNDDNDVMTEIFKSKAIIMGSPTVGNSVLHTMAGFTHFMKSMKFKNKKAAAFGCYGWSGEGVKVLNGLMKDAGFEVVSEGFRNSWNPDEDAENAAVEYGKTLAALL
jgi:flavorubredoxin